MVAFKEAVQVSLDRLAEGNQDKVPSNEVSMWAAHLTISYYVAERFIQDIEEKLASLESEQPDSFLYLPERNIGA